MRGRLFETLPSRFLAEIPMKLLDPVRGAGWNSGTRPSFGGAIPGSPIASGSGGSSPSGTRGGGAKPHDPDAWRAGMAVYHEDYGPGVVSAVKPTENGGPLVVVRFETGKEARFFPAFTKKLERLR
jgi:hypothetical protein